MDNGAGAGLSSSGRLPEGADVFLRGAADEAGLTLDPPYRYRSILVPVDGDTVQTARDLGISLGD